MTKLKLCALSSQKNEILDALAKTRSVEVVDTEEVADTFLPSETVPEELNAKSGDVQDCIDFVFHALGTVKGEKYFDKDLKALAETPVISFDEFFASKEKEADLLEYIDRTLSYKKQLADEAASRQKLKTLYEQYLPYETVEGNFLDYKDTAKTKVRLGQIKKDGLRALYAIADETPVSVTEYLSSELVTAAIVNLKENDDDIAPILSSNGFIKCQFTDDVSAKEEIERIKSAIESSLQSEKDILKSVYDEADRVKELYVLSDYYKFGLEKFKDGEKFRYTNKTFVLEGYLPKEKESLVKEAIDKVTDAVVVEYSVPSETDVPPTLCKNGKLVSQAEFVTDMYSTPDYREYDPNGFVFFFYMLFMGIIMADVGYGFLMIGLGLVLASRIKPGKSKKLWNVIAISGVFTIFWGVLFNSYFGFALPFYQAPLPNPIPQGGNTDGMKAILLLCLLLGVVHLAAGYLVKAINFFRKGDIFGGICEGISWVIFFIGFVFAAFIFILDYLIPGFTDAMNPSVKKFFETMTMPGVYMALGGVAFAALTAGRAEKGFGKFTKGFSSVYGLINLMSDILSYARLFGLMLSGMMISQTFNVNLAQPVMAGGGFGIVAGILIMVAGHAFNLAMGVLGAYIHDSRLQYIEFFGKFYTGEGRPFVPLGSRFDYVYVSPDK